MLNINGVRLQDSKLDLSTFEDIIALCTFGSYNEPCFNKDRSDMKTLDMFLEVSTEKIMLVLS